MAVTVYSKPACVQCDATKRALDKQGTPYISIDLSEDASAMQKVTELGYRQAPVVMAGERHWAGYLPAQIKPITEAEMAPKATLEPSV